jgi:hypothetical protein
MQKTKEQQKLTLLQKPEMCTGKWYSQRFEL